MKGYIYQLEDWTNFRWQAEALINLLSESRDLQGRLLGKMELLGFDLQKEAVLDTLTLDVLKMSEIEGEYFNSDQVRSSVATDMSKFETADQLTLWA